MSEYRLRPRADRDLEEIWRYTAQRWNFAQADAYVAEIMVAIQSLANRHGNETSGGRNHANYHRHLIGSHAIYFRLQGKHDLVVIRILHQSMDAPRHLRPR